MISGIESVNSENRVAYNATVNAFENALTSLEKSMRGRPNTTILNDRKEKARLSPTSEDGKITILQPNDYDKVLNNVRSMPQIKNGSFRINDTVIDVHPHHESFRSLVHKINSAHVGLIARYDFKTNSFQFQSNSGEKTVSFSDDTSNFLQEVNVKEGSYKVTEDGPMYMLPSGDRSVSGVISAIESVNVAFNKVLSDDELSDETKQVFTQSLTETLEEQNGSVPGLNGYHTDWGLNVNFAAKYKTGSKETYENIVTANKEAMRSHLQKDSRDIVGFYSGNNIDSGFARRAYAALDEISTKIKVDLEDAINIDVQA